MFKIKLKANAKLRVAFAVKLAAKAQDGGRRDTRRIRQLADGHVHDFVTVFNDIVVDHHLQVIETGNGGVGEHTHNGITLIQT